MGKRRLLSSMAVGALVGGIYALLDKDTRNYSKQKWYVLKDKTSYVVKNPSDAIHRTRTAFDQFSRNFNYQAENAINALEQVENTLEKVTKSDNSKIEG